MLSLNPYKHYHYSQSPFKNLPKQTQTISHPTSSAPATRSNYKVLPVAGRRMKKFVVRGCSSNIQGEKKEENKQQQQQNETRRNFLTLEEAGLVEMSGLSTHERFLCRLTVSSLNLLRVISEQEGCAIEELNAGRICDWFIKDKLKREQNLGSAVLQWDDSHMQF